MRLNTTVAQRWHHRKVNPTMHKTENGSWQIERTEYFIVKNGSMAWDLIKVSNGMSKIVTPYTLRTRQDCMIFYTTEILKRGGLPE